MIGMKEIDINNLDFKIDEIEKKNLLEFTDFI